MTPCPGGCNGPWRKAENARDDNGDPIPHALRPDWGDPNWCSECGRRIAAHLAELDDLAALIGAQIDGHNRSSSDDGPITGTKTRPSPSPAVDDLDEITRTLAAWEIAYRELRRLPAPPPRPADLALTMCIGWLSTHLTGALMSDLGRDLGEEITRLHVMARKRCHTDKAKRRMPEPCPRCGTKGSITHDAGAGHVACSHCGRLVLLAEWDAYVLDLARGEQVR